jgi:hypothetical protein
MLEGKPRERDLSQKPRYKAFGRVGAHVQLMFFRLKASDAAPNTATSVAPARSASSNP